MQPISSYQDNTNIPNSPANVCGIIGFIAAILSCGGCFLPVALIFLTIALFHPHRALTITGLIIAFLQLVFAILFWGMVLWNMGEIQHIAGQFEFDESIYGSEAVSETSDSSRR